MQKAAAAVAGLIIFANGFDVNSTGRRKGLGMSRQDTRPLLLLPLASTGGDPVGDPGGGASEKSGGGNSAFKFKDVKLKPVAGAGRGDDGLSESVNPSTISFNSKCLRSCVSLLHTALTPLLH